MAIHESLDEATETIVVQSETHFREVGPAETDPMTEHEAESLWYFWQQDDRVLIVIPEWLSDKEFDQRRPYLLGRGEFDSQDKGSILFDDLVTFDIGTVESPEYDRFSFVETVEPVDITPSDYVDEPGMDWLPRSYTTIFERADG